MEQRNSSMKRVTIAESKLKSREKEKPRERKDSEFMAYDWKINPLDNITETGSSFLLRSPKFICGATVGKSSEWFISIKYSPESRHLHADVSLVRFDDPAQKEVYAHTTLYIMRSSKLVSFALGTVKRTFTTDQSEIFRRDDCDSCGLPILQFKTIDMKMLSTLMIENNLIVRAEFEIFRHSPSNFPIIKLGEETNNDSQNSSSSSSSTTTNNDVEQFKPNEKPIWETQRHIIPNCTLKCGDSIFPIHTPKLAAASPVFATIFQSFKHLTDGFHASKSAVLTIKNIDAKTMKIILNHIYNDKFELNWSTDNVIESHVKKLLIAAEAYQLFVLRDLVLMEMCNNLNLKNCAEVAVLARTLQLKPIFKKRINAFIRKNWSSLQKDKKFLDTFNRFPQAFEFIFSSKLH